MANRVPQGKGSSDRTRDREAFDANFESIRWPSRGVPAPVGNGRDNRPTRRSPAEPQTEAEAQ